MKTLKAKKTIALLMTAAMLCGFGGCIGDNNTGSNTNSGGNSPAIANNDERTPDWFIFNTVDLYGNKVSHETFADKDIVIVYNWGTWCPPCVNGMPDTAKLVKEYGDRVGFLALVDDFASKSDQIKKIVENVDMPKEFIMVDPHIKELSSIYSEINVTGALPTSMWVYKGVAEEPLVQTPAKFKERLDDYFAKV